MLNVRQTGKPCIENKAKYPYLGVFPETGLIVLFPVPNHGMTMRKSNIVLEDVEGLGEKEANNFCRVHNSTEVGEYRTKWPENLFDTYRGTLEISNFT